MKIIGLQSRNIKNIKAIEITPIGNKVVLTGANAAGKSAILDSIFSALTGKRLKDPIRHGQERADVVVNMGDFVVKKRWTEKGEAIQVYSVAKDGKKHTYSSPQQFLNEKIGRLSFDPLAFKDMKPTEQIDLLKEIVGLNFDDIHAKADRIYNERTAVNSKIKDCLAQLKNTDAPEPGIPAEEISFKVELEKINQLREKRRFYIAKKEEKEELENSLVKCQEEVKDLKQQIEALQNQIIELEQTSQETKGQIEAFEMPQTISAEEVIAAESALQEIETQNVKIRAANRYRVSVKQGEKHKKESDALTQKLERMEQDKATRVANATFPIKGLSLSDVSILYEGMQFGRLSTGQQIRVSTAIGMALNPELRVIFIREGSLLDKINLKEIVEQAKEKDYQIWIEVCSDSDEVGFHIEDGRIATIDGKKVE